MRIAIVDDCENERNELCKRLSQSSFSRSYDIEICGYGNGTTGKQVGKRERDTSGQFITSLLQHFVEQDIFSL